MKKAFLILSSLITLSYCVAYEDGFGEDFFTVDYGDWWVSDTNNDGTFDQWGYVDNDGPVIVDIEETEFPDENGDPFMDPNDPFFDGPEDNYVEPDPIDLEPIDPNPYDPGTQPIDPTSPEEEEEKNPNKGCGDGEFRNSCGDCQNASVSENSVIEVQGECNAVNSMLNIQRATKNEVSGFFLGNGVMVILPNNENEKDRSTNTTLIRDENGKTLYAFYKEDNGWFADFFDASGNIVTVTVTGHFHTHPPGGSISKEDTDFTRSVDFSGIENYYIINANGTITSYNKNGIISTEDKDCENNGENNSDC